MLRTDVVWDLLKMSNQYRKGIEVGKPVMSISLVTYIDRYGGLYTVVAIQFASKVKYKEI